jgi:RNA polymerase sigma-70 factor (ECF subfamily)
MDDRRRRFEAEAVPHLDAAYSLARWLSRSPSDAEDIVQDAMLRAFRAYDGFQGGDAKPWLLAIVRNCWRDSAADRRRRAQVPIPEEESQPLIAPDPDPERRAQSASEQRRLDGAIAALPEEFREALVLREIEDLSYREIAEITGTPIGTVMSRLARARALLREKYLAKERA